jgi:hypothetical protein
MLSFFVFVPDLNMWFKQKPNAFQYFITIAFVLCVLLTSDYSTLDKFVLNPE